MLKTEISTAPLRKSRFLERAPLKTSEPILYYSPGSCSLAVHIVVEEIGKPYRLERVITDTGETRTPEFRRINPKGRIPVLIEGDVIRTEVPALLMHLAQGSPGDEFARRVMRKTFKRSNGLTGFQEQSTLLLFVRFGGRNISLLIQLSMQPLLQRVMNICVKHII
jgi:Glutathione S-transferase, N-terminal domain